MGVFACCTTSAYVMNVFSSQLISIGKFLIALIFSREPKAQNL